MGQAQETKVEEHERMRAGRLRLTSLAALLMLLNPVGCGQSLHDRLTGTWAMDCEAAAEAILSKSDAQFEDLSESDRRERIREMAERMREHSTVDRIEFRFSEDGSTLFMKPLRELYEERDWITDGRDFSKGCAVEAVDGDRMLLAATDQYGNVHRFHLEIEGDRLLYESEKSDRVVYCKRVSD